MRTVLILGVSGAWYTCAMKWSWRIGRIGGIDLRVHATFALLLAWSAIAEYRQVGTAVAAGIAVLFTLALFGSVVLHELGHALVAKRYGLATRDITLLPIGGLARLERMPEKPAQELRIALAGPAVTLAIVLVLYAGLRSANVAAIPDDAAIRAGRLPFVLELMWANVALLVFNLIPAFPMDGGRVLRALLAFRMPHGNATLIASRIGRGFAVLFAVVGLLYSPILVLIALFVWVSAVSESAATQMHAVLQGVPVSDVMVRDFHALKPGDTLESAVAHVIDGFQTDFPVVDDGNVVGVVTRAGLLAAIARDGVGVRVDQAMDVGVDTANPDEPAEHALERLSASPRRVLPVVRNGRLVGVLTLDNVGEYALIGGALRRHARAV